MVKIVSSLAAQLAAAEKRIEDLEKKNEALSRENKLLRASSTHRILLSPPPSPTSSLISTLSTNKSRRSEARYDSPTQASTNRAAEIRVAKRPEASLKCKEIYLNGGTYVYADARLTKINGPDGHEPQYMQPTRSFRAKACDHSRYCDDPWNYSFNSLGESMTASDDSLITEDTKASEETTPSEDTTPSEEAVDGPKDPSQYDLTDFEKLMGTEVKDSFPGCTAHIPSRAGHALLKVAHEIAQEAFYEAARKHVCISSVSPKETTANFYLCSGLVYGKT